VIIAENDDAGAFKVSMMAGRNTQRQFLIFKKPQDCQWMRLFKIGWIWGEKGAVGGESIVHQLKTSKRP